MALTQADRKIMMARSNLVLEQPFFGVLALRLELVDDKTCPTMWTDGTSLGFNPDYVEKLSLDEVTGVIAHEVLHAANGHCWRRGGRQKEKWNYAADAVVNPIVVDAGFRLPAGGVQSPRGWLGKSVEWVYSQLPDQPGGGGGGGGQGNGDDDGGVGCGEVRDAPSEGVSEGEWQVATIQAANAARQAGNLPGSLSELVKQASQPRVDWRAALLRFVQETSANDYSWRLPNKRYLGLQLPGGRQGLYLPTCRSEQMPAIVVAVDTSGSISDTELSSFIGELQSIIDMCHPETTTVIQCDAAIASNGVTEYGPDDTLGGVKIHGRGGTDFRPPFDYVTKQGLEPACFIYLTDLEGPFPSAPEYPTMWVSVNEHHVAPFGETIYLTDGGVTR